MNGPWRMACLGESQYNLCEQQFPHIIMLLQICRYIHQQGCAKIPKRSGIQDPQDPRSGIMMDFGYSISGFVLGSWGSWIQHFRFCRGILGILDPTCSFCREILMDPGSWFSLHRGILGILDPAILPCRGILGILDPDILFCVGFRGSWILDFWHCMGSRGSCVSNFWQMHRL